MEQKIFVFVVSILVIVLLQMIDTAGAKGDPRDCEGKWNVSARVCHIGSTLVSFKGELGKPVGRRDILVWLD